MSDMTADGDSAPDRSTKNLVNPKLTTDQMNELAALLEEYADVFSHKLGNTNLVEHKISLILEDLKRLKPYPVPFSVRDTIKDEIQEMLNLGIIEHSDSPYAAPVVLVPKRYGSTWFCIDYRRLNKLTVYDPEPMNQHEDIFSKLKTDRFYSKIDLSKGYWQIGINEEDKLKTAFTTPDQGNFHFVKMQFGLFNSAATFTRMMHKLLKGLNDVDSYIDDLLVHTPTWEAHFKVLKSLLQWLRAANLTAKLKKCLFGHYQLEYVGHEVGDLTLGCRTITSQRLNRLRDLSRRDS